MILTLFTLFHVALSLAGIFAGFAVVFGLLSAKRFNHWTAIFLLTTVLTSVTGFFFPVHHFMPSHGVGIVSLLVLPIAIFALYGRHLEGRWRSTYVITAMIGLYLNVVVLIAQTFAKVPLLKAIAPTQSEPPFAIAQLVLLLLFVVLTVFAVIRFHPEKQSLDRLALKVA